MTDSPSLEAGSPALQDLPEAPAAGSEWERIRSWRKETRETLLRRRAAMPVHTRRLYSDRVRQKVLSNVDLSTYRCIGFYSPIRNELSCLEIARDIVNRGGVVALPVVVERAAPVEFWSWKPGDRMQRGLWDIPIPAERNVVTPEALIVPLVGFDSQCYRLGYGGGYYDRTLASLNPRPFCIGVGFSDGALPSILPQAHDIPMDVIATESTFVSA